MKPLSICGFLFTLTFFFQLAPGARVLADTPAKMTDYHPKSGEFSLKVPTGWEIQENVEIQGYKIPVIALRPSAAADNSFRDNVNVTREAIPAGMTTSGYFDANVKAIANALGEFKMVKSGDLKGGFAGTKYLIYTHRSPLAKDRLKVFAFFYTKNSVGYVVTCTSTVDSFNRFVELYNQVGASFIPDH